MASIKAPSVNIAFIEKAISAIARGDRGIVVVAIKEASEMDPFTVMTIADIPVALTDANKEQIKMALKGYSNAPKKVIVYVMNSSAESLDEEYTNMMNYLYTEKWQYLAIPTVETDGKAEDIATWIKSCRQNKKLFKAVLPNIKADCEGVVNVTGSLVIGDKTYTPEECCARVAGLIAGTAITISCTYAPLMDADDCNRLQDLDTPVGAGEFIFMNDGEKVKVVRGVNSFVTTTDTKGDSFKKIKIVEAMDMIADDIRQTAEDSYLGKYANSYDNKCLLIMAINGYFRQLVTDGVLSGGSASIDVEGTRTYWMSKGGLVKLEDGSSKNIVDCSDDEIKRSNTGSQVFLTASISILDALEDIELPIYI